MKIKSDDLLNIHLPRWEEFPAFGLYIDQVLSFINENLAIFRHGDEQIITPSMINNYVKSGVLHPPVKKKYDREHLAKLMFICIAKRMLSLSDINDCIHLISRFVNIGDGYDLFCSQLEYDIFSSVRPDLYPPRDLISAETREIALMRAITSAVARTLIFDRIIGQRRRLSQLVETMK